MDNGWPSVRGSLESALPPEGLPRSLQAALALARRLSDEIDSTGDPDVVARLSLRLLGALKACGLTHADLAEPVRSDPALDELRARREAG
jgi:hypothetical protein